MSKSIYTAVVKRTGDWWVGWVQEIPGVNAQERTKDELLVSLRQALREAIERGNSAHVSVDLQSQTITGPGGFSTRFEIDPFRKKKLLEGLDEKDIEDMRRIAKKIERRIDDLYEY